MCSPQLFFCRIKNLFNFEFENEFENTYKSEHSYSHSSSQNHIITCLHDKLRAPTRGYPATCSRSCRDHFSSCVTSRTCPPSLARSRHRIIIPWHHNIRSWQTYKCQLLSKWCLYCPPFPFATILEIFRAASYGCNFRKPWGTHNHSVHTSLSLEVGALHACNT